LRKSIAAMAAVMVLTVAVAAGGAYFYVEDRKNAEYDLDKRVPMSELYFKDYDDTPYSEALYYQFEIGDGSDFFCHFLYGDIGFGIKYFGVDYKLFTPGEKPVFFGTQFDTDESSMSKASFQWKVGGNSAGGDADEQRIHIVSGPLKVDVTLETVVPYYQVGDGGMMYLDDEREEWGKLTIYPHFKVTGKILNGSTVIDVDGWGYGNKIVQAFDPRKLSDFHTALRWQKNGVGFDVHDYYTPEDNEWLPVLMVYKDGRMIHVSQDYTKENLEYFVEPKSGRKVPTSYRVVSEGDDIKVTIEFTDVSASDYNDPLMSLGRIQKAVINLFADPPIDLRFDGHVKFVIETPEYKVVEEGPGHGLALVAVD